MATYVPNATQATEPVESRTVESAALEFRTLKGSVNGRVDALQADIDAEIADRLADAAALQAEVDAVEVRTLALEQLAFNGSTPGAVTVQRFACNGVQTVFVLAVTPVTVTAVDAYINGVYQNHDTFSVSGNTITFTEAPTAGAVLEMQLSVPLQLGTTTADAVEYTPAGTGAVATTVQSKLRESVSVFDFMTAAQISDVQAGTSSIDVTDAVQAALAYAYASATGPSWRRDTPEVVLPHGKYRIAKPNELFKALSFYNGKITGAGRRGGTEIVYDVPAATSSDYLLYNNDVLGFIQFHGIRFSSKNVVANQNFMYYRSIGNAQHFTWTECEWDGFSQIFNVQGPANASENTFYTCKFANFSDCAFRLNNPQAVNWRFYACEAEAFTGALFEYLQGANVVWYQGSIIPTASTARILRVPAAADSNAFGSGNNPNMLFHAVRFEMRDGALMTDKQNSATGFVVIFDACNMGGSNIPDPATYKAFTWVGAGKIELRSCTNLSNYRFNHSVAGALNHILEVKIDNSPVPAEMIFSSTFSITGGSTQNTGFGPTFYVSRCGSRVDGEYKVRDSQYMNNAGSNYNSVVKTRHAVAFSPETNTIAITSGGTFDLYVPPTRVIAVEIYPVANAGGAGQATITVKNAAGTVTLGTATYWIAAPGTVKLASDCNYFVDAMNGDYLKVEITHSYTAGVVQQFKGQMYLTY